MCYAVGQSLHDGTFSHTRFSNNDGIILFAAAQNLYYSFNFPFATYHGVQPAFNGHGCQIRAEVVRDRCVA